MKNAVAYFLCLFYAVAMLKPVLPVLKDFLAHTFTPELHIATVHNENGSKHVHYEIAATATKDADESKNIYKFSDPVSEHVNAMAIVLPAPFTIEDAYLFSYKQDACTSEKNIVVPPPRCNFFKSIA